MMVPDWTGYLAFREAFRSVIDERYWPIDWLDQRVLDGIAKFIRSDNAAIIVEIRQYPGGATDVHGLIAAGSKDEIVNDLIPQAEAWGRENGCVAGVVESRPGWARALKPCGYEVAQVTVRKEFLDGPLQ
jgi:hypothetical protein